MTAVVAPGPLVRARPARTSALTGTAGMLRLALRRDRWRLLAWVAGVVVLYLAALGEYALLADDPRGMQARAVLMRTPAMVTMAGPGYGLDDYTVGAAVANELVLWMVLALAVLSILEVVRHTRAEEESGRSELLRAGAVGRHAPAVAALLLVVAVQAVVAGVTGAVVAAGGGLPAGESFAMTGAVALGALVFAAVALVAAQVAEHGRTATGLSLAVLGAAFAARARRPPVAPGSGPAQDRLSTRCRSARGGGRPSRSRRRRRARSRRRRRASHRRRRRSPPRRPRGTRHGARPG